MREPDALRTDMSEETEYVVDPTLRDVVADPRPISVRGSTASATITAPLFPTMSPFALTEPIRSPAAFETVRVESML